MPRCVPIPRRTGFHPTRCPGPASRSHDRRFAREASASYCHEAMRSREALLVAYDTQLRARVPERLPPGVRAEHDGPLVRILGSEHGGFVGYGNLGGLDGPELDALIKRQIDVFGERGERFEWKLHGHDRSLDLPER